MQLCRFCSEAGVDALYMCGKVIVMLISSSNITTVMNMCLHYIIIIIRILCLKG